MNNLNIPFSFTLPTKIIYRPGCITSLMPELALYDGKKPMIITDKGVREMQAGAKEAVEAVKKLAIDVGLPSFSSLDININDFGKLAEMATTNISTQSNPRPMDKEDYLLVLNKAY